MRFTSAWLFALALCSGCLGRFVHAPDDGGGMGNDLATAGKDMAGGGGPRDMSGGGGDMSGGNGTAAFGDTCTVDSDCAGNMCRQFQGGAVLKCTKPCTVATQTADCPNPPSLGTCTNQLYCRF